MAKVDQEKEDPHRQIIPTAEDPELCDFLEDLFHLHNAEQPGKPNVAPDLFPDRIVLRTVHGKAGKDLGPVLLQQEWKATTAPQPKQEAIVALSNKILSAARHDAQALGKEQRYVVLAYSAVKGANSYARHLLKVKPGPKEYLERDSVPDEEELVDGTTPKALLSELFRDRRFHQELSARMFTDYRDSMEGLIGRYEARLSQVEHVNSDLLRAHMELIKTKEELLDRKAARELRERKEAFWQERIERAFGIAEHLLPPLVASMTQPKGGIVDGIKRFAMSLDSAQRDALLGEWTDDGQRVSEGILDEQQVETFGAILDGKLGAEHVGGFLTSLRQEQMIAAQAVLKEEQIGGLLAVYQLAQRSAQANGAAS